MVIKRWQEKSSHLFDNLRKIICACIIAGTVSDYEYVILFWNLLIIGNINGMYPYFSADSRSLWHYKY